MVVLMQIWSTELRDEVEDVLELDELGPNEEELPGIE